MVGDGEGGMHLFMAISDGAQRLWATTNVSVRVGKLLFGSRATLYLDRVLFTPFGMLAIISRRGKPPTVLFDAFAVPPDDDVGGCDGNVLLEWICRWGALVERSTRTRRTLRPLVTEAPDYLRGVPCTVWPPTGW